jgi:integrase
MKVGEIQTDHPDGVWIYRPTNHKNTWRGHSREIPFWKPLQAILRPRMEGKLPDDYVFSPADAMREKWELAAASRKSKITPSQQARKEKRAKNPKTKFRPCYTSESYGKAITKAIAVANKHLPVEERLVHFTAYQLRHSGVTKLIEKYGIDVARAIAGHRSAGVTMGYNHADEKIATRIAEERRNPFKE